jgi:hypothetical protein
MTLEQFAGAALMLLFLADVFLTILYARAGTGLLAPHWNRLVWASFKALARLIGRHRSAVMSFAGPVIVSALILFWALGLTIGAALMIQPELGTAIRPSTGGASTDFVTALLVAGNSLSIVGGGSDYSPHTSATRILFLINSLIGASVLSLVLSYLVQVHSSLRERNALSLTVDLMTGSTGEAAEMLARLGPVDDFSSATSELSKVTRSLAATKEAHQTRALRQSTQPLSNTLLSPIRPGRRPVAVSSDQQALRAHLDHRHHQSRIRRIAFCVRRRQDDDRAAGPAHLSLRDHRNRKRILAL